MFSYGGRAQIGVGGPQTYQTLSNCGFLNGVIWCHEVVLPERECIWGIEIFKYLEEKKIK